jgi:hypothetical protein
VLPQAITRNNSHLIAFLILIPMLLTESAEAKNNTACKKPQKEKISKGTTYRCVSNGEDLVWANKKLRKKIFIKLKNDSNAKRQTQKSIDKFEETTVRPPKNPDTKSTVFTPNMFDRSDFRSLRSEGFMNIKTFQTEFLRYQNINKQQNENLLQDYRRALNDIKASGWLDYDFWYAETELKLSGEDFEKYMEKAEKRVQKQLQAGIDSINETSDYFAQFPSLFAELVKYFKDNDPNFSENLLNEALKEAQDDFDKEYLVFQAQVEDQERQYQNWIAENIKYQKVELSRFNRIYKEQYLASINQLQDSLKNVESYGLVNHAKWKAEFELGLKGVAFEEYISKAIAEVQESIRLDIESYRQTLEYYEQSQRQFENNVEYLSDSSYAFSDEFLENAIRDAIIIAERDYQTYVANEIRATQSSILLFKSLNEPYYRSKVEEFSQQISNVENSSDFQYEIERASELGLEGAERDTFLAEARNRILSDLQSQLEMYQVTINQYAEMQAYLDEQIDYLEQNEFEFTEDLLSQAFSDAEREAAEMEEAQRAAMEEQQRQFVDEMTNEQPAEENPDMVSSESDPVENFEETTSFEAPAE